MSFDLSTTMDGIAAYAISSGVCTRAYGYPEPNPEPPCFVVDYPSKLDFDYTFHTLTTVGVIEATFPLYFLVSHVLEKDARDALSLIISGATGIKNLLDGSMGGTFLQTARVVDCKIVNKMFGGVPYLAAQFDLDVIA